MNFDINLIFLIKPFFFWHDQTVMTKIYVLENEKSF